MSRIDPVSICPAFASAFAGERRSFAESLAASNRERPASAPTIAFDLVLAAQNDDLRRSRLMRKPTPSIGRLIDLLA